MALQWVTAGNNRGPQGIQGPAGPTGGTGSVGPAGETGATGPTGAQGVQGVAGPQGVGFDPAPSVALVADLPAGDPIGTTRLVLGPGSPSEAGPAGHIYAKEAGGWTDMGQSAYIGPAGAQGPTGATGGTGATGPQGAVGPDGPTGLTGAQGVQGITGSTGAQGPSGSNGVRGSKWVSWDGVTPPTLVGVLVGDFAQGSEGSLLQAVDI